MFKKYFNCRHLFKILGHPLALVPAIILGLYFGIFQKQISVFFTPFGNLYLALLKMCVLPILFSATTMSVGQLIKSQDTEKYIKRILLVFSVGLLACGIIGVIMAVITNPGGNLDESTLTALGVIVNSSELDLEVSLSSDTPKPKEESMLITFLFNLIPDNIFSALSEGNTLKVLFFSIIFGVALGSVKESSASFFVLLDTLYKGSKKLIDWLIIILPFGLFCLLSSQIAKTGFGIVLAMGNFVAVTIFTYILIYCLSTLVISKQAHTSFQNVCVGLQEPTLLALATRSSFSCLPSCISSLTTILKFDIHTVDLVIPLAITVCRFGSVTYFAICSVFIAQLYHTSLNLSSFFIIIIASIFAGMATAGTTGVLTLTLLDLVLKPLGLPLEAVLVLLIAIDPIIDPFRTLGIVHTAIASTAAIADHQSSVPQMQELAEF
ncbi:Sodium:dicarboxylate symporter [Planktothrix serta PCC 8927]|uniref:Sodium:dicarboxylate symporter n=1 Tax=Planktothrix serta PCC 8927 TaxID=671068 RepID=A0A7Z9E091_9CYAN|nr:cation:dicarboxylase symporter family transporter [Planktothrix serta]VXD16030.1 Sodium:dicarboxylate symporter [Planktothrix serta PCC 8927]